MNNVALAGRALRKASFASRSEAGRYAANMRWQGQGKVFDGSTDDTNFNLLDQNKDKFLLSDSVRDAVAERINTEISAEDQADLFIALGQNWYDRERMIQIISDRQGQNFLKTFENLYTGSHDEFATINGSPFTPSSIALQEAVRRRFNPLNAKPTSEKANSDHLKLINNPTMMKVCDIIVDEVYKDTQRYLAEKGVKSVVLYRGTKNDELAAAVGSKNMTVRLRPFASFTSEKETADMFAQKNDWMGRKAKGVILKAKVDAKNVFSIGRVNFGMEAENEVLVLGGDITVDVTKFIPSKRFPD